MPTKTTRRTTTATRKPRPRADAIIKQFRSWLEAKDQAVVLGALQGGLRERLVETIKDRGDADDKGNVWLDLPEPVEFTDHDGKTFVYTTLKNERHVSKPTVDVEKAEELLRKKKLWLTPAQEKAVVDIQTQCPYVTIGVSIDLDALEGALFKKIITPAQYESILYEAKVSTQFRPQES